VGLKSHPQQHIADLFTEESHLGKKEEKHRHPQVKQVEAELAQAMADHLYTPERMRARAVVKEGHGREMMG
jgi:hypothetical protein